MKLLICSLSNSGGGNIALQNIRNFADQHDTIKINSGYNFKKISLHNKLIKHIINVIIVVTKASYYSIFRDYYVIYSDPIICSASFLFRKNKRIRYVQSDDINLYIKDDGYPVFLIKIIKLMILFASKIEQKLIIFNSDYTWMEYCKLDNKPKKIIHPPLNINLNNKKPKEIVNKLIIGYFARRHKRKGLELFKEVISGINNVIPIEVRIVTQDNIAIMGNHYLVLRPKNREQAISMMKEFDIFISTTTFEGFGMPVLEALACGVPVVAIDNMGVREIYNNQNLYLVSDAEQMIEAVKKIYHDPSLRNMMINKGLETAKIFLENNPLKQIKGYLEIKEGNIS